MSCYRVDFTLKTKKRLCIVLGKKVTWLGFHLRKLILESVLECFPPFGVGKRKEVWDLVIHRM